MAKTRVVIGEDDLLIAEHLSTMLRELGYELVGIGTSELEVTRLLAQSPDIALLDINLDAGEEGIDIGRHIRDHVHIPFLYITAHTDTATLEKALKTQPSAYLVKPFDRNDIYTAIELALSNHAAKQPAQIQAEPDAAAGAHSSAEYLVKDALFAKVNDRFERVPYDSITHLQASNNYTMIYTNDARHLIRGSLQEITAQLPDEQFFRVHKSYSVNLDHVTAINAGYVEVAGEEVPLSSSYRPVLLKRLHMLK